MANYKNLYFAKFAIQYVILASYLIIYFCLLICDGHTYKVIGETSFISERTVTKHIQNIFEKLHVSNKIELINKLEAAEHRELAKKTATK